MGRIWHKRDRRGVTLIELLITIAVLGVLASVAMPLVEVTVKRTEELELRRALRHIREGVDKFKIEYDKGRQRSKDAKEIFKKRVSFGRTGYPRTLDEMVETKILRRIPKDPMTKDGQWITRSYSDSLKSTLTDGKDVYDVRTDSTKAALNGSTYDTW
ncbi:MAG: prepilin-type N-terminal cleavage/methylation domain-containing protein [candidate division NC10 bacterium]|nr:prepilin-type N-terminal cleavage/methylation domain-containing protein [candidate division NC10 bacterium]